jgi:hypothetical protein
MNTVINFFFDLKSGNVDHNAPLEDSLLEKLRKTESSLSINLTLSAGLIEKET